MKKEQMMKVGFRALCALGIAGAMISASTAKIEARLQFGRPVLTYRPAASTPLRPIALPDGKRVKVDKNGFATIYDGKKIVGTRFIPVTLVPTDAPGTAAYQSELSGLQWAVEGSAQRVPFAAQRLLVVFRDAITARDHMVVPKQTISAMAAERGKSVMYQTAPAYTNDTLVNRALADAAVTKIDRLFSSVDRGTLSSMRAQAQARLNKPLLNIGNAFAVNISHGSVENAVAALRVLPAVAYVSADWSVAPMLTAPRALPDAERQSLSLANAGRVRDAARLRSSTGGPVMEAGSVGTTPTNYAVASNLQSLLDSTGIDDIAAYQEIMKQFHQLPGTGETITNVSVGDIYAAEDGTGTSTPANLCPAEFKDIGAMTQTIGGQRYLNWPGLPLIPAYAADANGRTDRSYVSCGEGGLDEIGLDFSMMSPLPDDQQRSGERASSAIGDLLGIAPGASYRLFVPATNTPQGGDFLSNIDGAFLAAAQMAPKTDVITASLGEGFDAYGFPGRYLEDDPLTQSLIATIVNDMNIVVCISANDGTRAYTPVAIGISGGSAATNVVTDQTQTTNLNDLAYSTTPSLDVDSGAIDVGGVTLNDVYSAPPGDPAYASLVNQLAFPETRYNGGQNLSSGFGSRVNISAPSDNVGALDRVGASTFDGVRLFNEGGTSASAPEVAAAAAIAMQVAKLTGHPFTSARSVRDFLVQTATPVAQAAITDAPLNVGPEVNVRRAIEKLLSNAGITVAPSLSRIGVFQRQSAYPLDAFDTLFFTNTDLANINLNGHDYGDGRGRDGSGFTDYIDVAPDWQGMPSSAQYSLFVTGHPDRVLATTPTARLLPAQILKAAGIAVPAPSGGVVRLTYRASSGMHMLAQGTVELDFGPTDGTSIVAPAPHVPAVVSAGSSFQVTYDVSKVRSMNNPVLVITPPGRFTASWGYTLHLPYSAPLSGTSGTVTVPASAMQGAGIYGVGIMGTDPTHGTQHLSNLALVRVQAKNASRPSAPLLALSGTTPQVYTHSVEMPYGGSVSVKWNVTSVPNAGGAELEVSAPGPTLAGIINTFNNPNGSEQDNNGFDTGSVKLIPLPGPIGSTTFTADELGLNDTMFHTVRVIALGAGGGVGEGGDVSSIIEDGQTNSIGGILDHEFNFFSGGFSINPNGTDAMMAAAQLQPNGLYLDSIDEFDHKTHADRSLANVFSGGPYSVRGGGFFGPDTAFFGQGQNSNSFLGTTYNQVNLLGSANPVPVGVALPSATDFIRQVSCNPSSSTAAVLFQDTNNGYGSVPLQIASLDFSTDTMGTVIPSLIKNDYDDAIYLFGADMGLNEALVLRSQWIDFTGGTPAYLDLVNLQTGATSTIQSLASGINDSLAVDDTTHMAMSDSTADNSLVLYNLQTHTQSKIPTPSTPVAASVGGVGGLGPFDPWFIAADTVNHLFLVWVPYGPTLGNLDYNATSPLFVFDENGNCIKTVYGWTTGSFGDITDSAAQYLQVNGNTRTAYLMVGSQLALIHY